MCGRFTLQSDRNLLARRFQVDLEAIPGLSPRYNIAPTEPILTVRHAGEERIAERMRWGLVPSWARDLSKLPSLINARRETLARKPSFRESFRHRRCLIPADGFFEWRAPEGLSRKKIPYWISLATGEPFAIAGLWAEWTSPDTGRPGETIHSCTIITTAARPSLRAIHDRMPVILPGEAEELWLDPSLDENRERLERLLVPVPDEALHAHPVSTRVNSLRNDESDLIRPLDDPSLGF